MSEIKLSLGKLKAIEESLGQLVNEKLPIKIAFRFSKLLPQLQEELKKAEEFRLKLINQYGSQNENGDMEVKPENMESFIKEMNELYSEELTLNFEPVSIDSLPDEVSVSAIQLSNLSDFLI